MWKVSSIIRCRKNIICEWFEFCVISFDVCDSHLIQPLWSKRVSWFSSIYFHTPLSLLVLTAASFVNAISMIKTNGITTPIHQSERVSLWHAAAVVLMPFITFCSLVSRYITTLLRVWQRSLVTARRWHPFSTSIRSHTNTDLDQLCHLRAKTPPFIPMACC